MIVTQLQCAQNNIKKKITNTMLFMKPKLYQMQTNTMLKGQRKTIIMIKYKLVHTSNTNLHAYKFDST